MSEKLVAKSYLDKVVEHLISLIKTETSVRYDLLDARVTTNTTDISGLDTRLDGAEETITTHTTDISNLATRVTTAEGDISTHTTDISNLTTRVTTAETNISTNTTDISNKMDKANPTGTGYLALNALADSTPGEKSVTTGGDCIASGQYSFATGYKTTASGKYAFAEGSYWKSTFPTEASGNASHCEGYSSIASGVASHCEGIRGEASGEATHCEGYRCESAGDYSHTEGNRSYAEGEASHAEGDGCDAGGIASHAEGRGTSTGIWDETNEVYTDGYCAHAQGYFTEAQANYSHAGGHGTIAKVEAQTVIGTYNADEASTLFIIGNGTDDDTRSNALVVYNDGRVNIANATPTGNNDLTTKQYVDTANSNKLDKTNPTATGYLALNQDPNYTLGSNAVAIGSGCRADNANGIAIGQNAVAIGDSISIGYGTWSVAQDGAMVVGRYNVPMSGRMFVVGGGTSDNDRVNLLAVNNTGTVTVTTDPVNNMDLATKQYVDNLVSQLSSRISALE